MPVVMVVRGLVLLTIQVLAVMFPNISADASNLHASTVALVFVVQLELVLFLVLVSVSLIVILIRLVLGL